MTAISVLAVQVSIDPDRECFTGVLVDDGRDLWATTTAGLIEDEVDRPPVIGPLDAPSMA